MVLAGEGGLHSLLLLLCEFECEYGPCLGRSSLSGKALLRMMWLEMKQSELKRGWPFGHAKNDEFIVGYDESRQSQTGLNVPRYKSNSLKVKGGGCAEACSLASGFGFPSLLRATPTQLSMCERRRGTWCQSTSEFRR
jgi:hypothetical protein